MAVSYPSSASIKSLARLRFSLGFCQEDPELFRALENAKFIREHQDACQCDLFHVRNIFKSISENQVFVSVYLKCKERYLHINRFQWQVSVAKFMHP